MRIQQLDQDQQTESSGRFARRRSPKWIQGNMRQDVSGNSWMRCKQRENDEALFDYTEKFDRMRKIDAETLRVTEEEIEEAYRLVDPDLVRIIRKALENIRAYHEKQRQYSWFRQSAGWDDSGTEGDTA